VPSTTRRHILRLAGTAAVAPLASRATWAQGSGETWPSKPIRLIVPLTPGSASDVMARIVADQLAGQLGQPIVVENRPHAGNTIGMAAVAKAEPDGHTILVNSSTHTVPPAKAPADIRAKLYAETAKALQQPATRDKLGNLGADAMPLTSAQFAVLVKTEIETNTQLVKAAGIKVN
jgi:tripartite-type tricarboxylate transporter receptor subunit TctC